LGMDESTRTSERNSCFQEENEDIVGTGLGLQLCKSMIKKNGGNSGLRANWERDKNDCIFA
jgi:K+-sensing histidine kinase KdpD